MSLLPTSGDTIIQDGTFTSAQTINNSYHIMGTPDQNPWQILERNIRSDALFDSEARFDPPKCHPETRTAVLDYISTWATDTNSLPLMWIRGAAGAGKSAIAQTLSERWDESDTLAASFYFSRTAAGRNEKKYLIATLAHQLSMTIPGIRLYIEGAIRQMPKVFERNLRTQMKQLIINPMVALSRNGLTAVKVVVIDGLDECCTDYPGQDHEQQQEEILKSIELALGQKGFPLRFLIASRPERQIREIFDHESLASMSSRTVLDDTQNPNADIELYLQCKLEDIRKRHPYLGPSWPSKDVVDQLVAKSSGHFIYVAVVIRFLSSPRSNPEDGLKTVMGIIPSTNADSPFAELDALYTHILNSVAHQSIQAVMNIFGLMIYNNISTCNGWDLFTGIKKMSPIFISRYLFISLGELHRHLIDLHSLLDIPSVEDATNNPISFLHASFSEFLTEPSRSVKFYIDKKQQSLHILSLSIRHLFVQILSPLGGTITGQYYRAGYAFQTSEALSQFEPDKPVLEALQALLTGDENEFLQYIRREGLDAFGTTRQSRGVIRYLYNLKPKHVLGFSSDLGPDIPVVIAVLKKHNIKTSLLLVDPLGYNPDLCAEYNVNNGPWVDSAEEAMANLSPPEQTESSDTLSSSSLPHPVVELEVDPLAPQDSVAPSKATGVPKLDEKSTTPSLPEETASIIIQTPEPPRLDEGESANVPPPSTQSSPDAPPTPTRKRRSDFKKRIANFLGGSGSGKGKP